MKIEVSIVCITYNQEQYVAEMLDGLVSQKTNFQYEILIHDDASTDGTQNIIEEYAKKYPDLIKPILQKENKFSKGINPNITYNYPRAQGRYIAYCEGDDYWKTSDKLQRQYDALEANQDCTICVHNVQCVFQNGQMTNRMFPPVLLPEEVISSNDYMRLELKDAGWLFQTSSFFIRAELVKKYMREYDNLYPVGDLPLVLFSLQYGNCYYINSVMSCYRLNSGGYMTNLKDRKKRISHCQKMIEGHRDFDQRTNGAFHAYFDYAILNKEVEILLLKKKYKDIFLPKYQIIRKQMSARRRILIFVGCIFPEIADFLEREKNGWTK